MPKTVQIRDIDDDVYSALARRAAEAGLTVPDLLCREAARLARRPSVEECSSGPDGGHPISIEKRSSMPWMTCAASGLMLVVDASALVEVLIDGPEAESIRARLATEPELAAPNLIDARPQR